MYLKRDPTIKIRAMIVIMALIVDLMRLSHQIICNLYVSHGNHFNRIEILGGPKKFGNQHN